MTSLPNGGARPATTREGSGAGLVVVTDTATFALRLNDGEPVSLRQVPAHTRPVDYGTPGATTYVPVTALLADGDPPERPSRVSVLGSPEVDGVVAHKAREDGWFVDRIDGQPDEIAARFARAVRGHQLLTQQGWKDRARRQAGSTIRFGLAAAAVLCAAAAAELWGTTRQTRAVQAERAALADRLAPVLTVRDSLTVLHDRMTQLTRLVHDGSRWASLLVDLSLRLPEDTYLTAFRAEGDSVVIDGWAKRTGAALEMLRTSPSFDAIRVGGPIRREPAPSGESLERFTLVVRIARPGTQPSAQNGVRTAARNERGSP